MAKLAFLLTSLGKEELGLAGRISKKENTSAILAALSGIELATKNKKTGIYKKSDLLKRYQGR